MELFEDAEPQQPAETPEKPAEEAQVEEQPATPEFETDNLTAGRSGQELEISEDGSTVSQKISLEKVGKDTPQTLSVTTKEEPLLSITQGGKTVATFTQKEDGTIQMSASKEFVDGFVAQHPEMKLGDSQEVGETYVFDMANLKLTQSGNIEAGEVRANNTNFAIMFSALGTQIRDAAGNLAKQVTETPFDITISTSFIESALSNANVISLEDKKPLFDNLMFCYIQAQRAKTGNDKQSHNYTINETQLHSFPVTLAEQTEPEYLSIMKHDGKSYLYVQTKGSVPQFKEIKNVSLQEDGTTQALYFGLDGNTDIFLPINDFEDENLKALGKTLQTEAEATKSIYEAKGAQEQLGVHSSGLPIAPISAEKQKEVVSFGNVRNLSRNGAASRTTARDVGPVPPSSTAQPQPGTEQPQPGTEQPQPGAAQPQPDAEQTPPTKPVKTIKPVKPDLKIFPPSGTLQSTLWGTSYLAAFVAIATGQVWLLAGFLIAAGAAQLAQWVQPINQIKKLINKYRQHRRDTFEYRQEKLRYRQSIKQQKLSKEQKRAQKAELKQQKQQAKQAIQKQREQKKQEKRDERKKRKASKQTKSQKIQRLIETKQTDRKKWVDLLQKTFGYEEGMSQEDLLKKIDETYKGKLGSYYPRLCDRIRATSTLALIQEYDAEIHNLEIEKAKTEVAEKRKAAKSAKQKDRAAARETKEWGREQESANEEINKINDQIAALQFELDEVNHSRQADKYNLETLKIAKEGVKSAEGEVKSAQKAVAEEERKLSILDDVIGQVETQQRQHLSLIDSLDEQIQAQEEAIKAQQDKVAKTKRSLPTPEQVAEQEAEKQRLEQMETTLGEMQERQKTAQSELEDLTQKHEDLTGQHFEQEKTIKTKKSELEDKKKSLEDAQKTLADQQKYHDIYERSLKEGHGVEALETQIDELKAKRDKANEYAERVGTVLDETKAAQNKTAEEREKADEELSELQSKANEKKEKTPSRKKLKKHEQKVMEDFKLEEEPAPTSAPETPTQESEQERERRAQEPRNNGQQQNQGRERA